MDKLHRVIKKQTEISKALETLQEALLVKEADTVEAKVRARIAFLESDLALELQESMYFTEYEGIVDTTPAKILKDGYIDDEELFMEALSAISSGCIENLDIHSVECIIDNINDLARTFSTHRSEIKNLKKLLK